MKNKALILCLLSILLLQTAQASWWGKARDAIVVGTGFGTFLNYSRTKQSTEYLAEEMVKHNHNILNELDDIDSQIGKVEGKVDENNTLLHAIKREMVSNHSELIALIENEVVGRKSTISFPFENDENDGLKDIVQKLSVYDATSKQYVGLNNYQGKVEECLLQASFLINKLNQNKEFKKHMLMSHNISMIDVNLIDRRYQIDDGSFSSGVYLSMDESVSWIDDTIIQNEDLSRLKRQIQNWVRLHGEGSYEMLENLSKSKSVCYMGYTDEQGYCLRTVNRNVPVYRAKLKTSVPNNHHKLEIDIDLYLNDQGMQTCGVPELLMEGFKLPESDQLLADVQESLSSPKDGKDPRVIDSSNSQLDTKTKSKGIWKRAAQK